MRAIRKASEPACLTQHRARPHSCYANLADEDKEQVRRALVSEQGGVCCYCMGRIRPDASAMKIEHWACQHANPNLQLSYGNLLAACLGGEGQPRNRQHCDTRKGGSPLKWNPADPARPIDAMVRYDVDGTIRSDDEAFDRQLGEVLNLNLAFIKKARGNILSTIADWWRCEKARRQGPIPRNVIERRLADWTQASPLAPHAGVAIWALRQRLAKAS